MERSSTSSGGLEVTLACVINPDGSCVSDAQGMEYKAIYIWSPIKFTAIQYMVLCYLSSSLGGSSAVILPNNFHVLAYVAGVSSGQARTLITETLTFIHSDDTLVIARSQGRSRGIPLLMSLFSRYRHINSRQP